MPASSGVQELTRLTDDQKLLFLELLDGLETDIDVLLIDTGAGISDTVLYFNLAANERIIVVTPGADFADRCLCPHKGALLQTRRTPLSNPCQPGRGGKHGQSDFRQTQQSCGPFPRRYSRSTTWGQFLTTRR